MQMIWSEYSYFLNRYQDSFALTGRFGVMVTNGAESLWSRSGLSHCYVLRAAGLTGCCSRSPKDWQIHRDQSKPPCHFLMPQERDGSTASLLGAQSSEYISLKG